VINNRSKIKEYKPLQQRC